jgi:hypothetical protein
VTGGRTSLTAGAPLRLKSRFVLGTATQLSSRSEVSSPPEACSAESGHEGAFFGLLADDTIYLRVDDGNRGDYEAAGMEPFRPYGDASYSMQYYQLPADVLEDRERLREWMVKAIAAARRNTTGKRKRS